MAAKNPKQPEQTFETAIERLEGIVEEMEGEKLPLERLLELYEEGTKLAKVCQERLDTAEKRIEIITRNSAGKPQLTEFDPAEAATAQSSSASVATGTTPAPAPVSAPRKPAPADPNEVSLF